MTKKKNKQKRKKSKSISLEINFFETENGQIQKENNFL